MDEKLDITRKTDSEGATVSIRLTPNRAPVAVPDQVTTSKFEISVPVTLNDTDTDADGDPLRVTSVNPSQSGATLTFRLMARA